MLKDQKRFSWRALSWEARAVGLNQLINFPIDMVLGEDFEADVIRNTLLKSKECAETASLKDYSWNVNSVNQVVVYNKHSEMLSK